MNARCCGIAGTYGLKAEKYEIAMNVGRSLFEQVGRLGRAGRRLRQRDLPLADQPRHGAAVGASDRLPVPGLRARRFLGAGPHVVGIVVVSHSDTLAQGVVALAREMSPPELTLEAAGGIGEPDVLGNERRTRARGNRAGDV